MPKDWNSVSQSGSQSQDQRSHEEQNQTKTEKGQSKQQTSQGSSEQQPNKSAENVKQRPKFMSDDELIEKIKAKQIEQRKKIKIVNCKSEELIDMIKNHKLINYLRQINKQGKPTTYVACFKTEQDLISFIQQKIANKYRFFLHVYIKTARDIEKQKQYEEKRKQREQENRNRNTNRNRDYGDDRKGEYRKEEGRREEEYRRGGDNDRRREEGRRENEGRRDYDNKRDNQPRRENDNKRENETRRGQQQGQKRRGRNRPQYDQQEKQQKQYQDRKDKRYQPKNPPSQIRRQQKPQPKQKPKQKPQTLEYNYIIEKNQIKILSNIYSKNRIVDDIVQRKMASKWDRIKIFVKKDGLNKVLELVELIWDRISYGLKALPDENSKDEFIEVVIETKSHVIHPNTQYGLLTDNSKKYFDKVGSKNKYIIQKEFSIEEYVKGFKQSQRDICKKWKDWIIKAQDENIPNLLKLSWKLRRQFYLNINIVVGKRGQVPFAVLQIQPQSDKQKRPKPDTSVVNNYLN